MLGVGEVLIRRGRLISKKDDGFFSVVSFAIAGYVLRVGLWIELVMGKGWLGLLCKSIIKTKTRTTLKCL